MTELIQFINMFQKLDAETEEAVRKYYTEETFRKNEFIVEAGKICRKVIFIKSGLIRRYFIHKGEDVTIWIYGRNQMATCMPSFFGQRPSYEYLQACEETVAYTVLFENDLRLLEYPLFVKFHIRQLRFYLAGVDEVNYRFKLMTAKEKYNYMLTYFPEIIQKAKLKHIASFLDISQSALSRIRSSII